MNDRRNPKHNPVITHWHPEMLKKVGGAPYGGSGSGATIEEAIDSAATAEGTSLADVAGNTDETNVEGSIAELYGLIAGLAAPTAADVTVTDSADYYTGTHVEAILAEIGARLATFLTRTDYTDDVTYVADAGASHTIEDPTANVQDITLTEANTLTFPTPTDGKAFLIRLHPDGNTVTWDSDVEWPGGTPPTLSGDLHIFGFLSDGTNWYGAEYGAATGGGGGTPDAHAASHQNGGSDEISVAGLSGLLADGQTPLAHKTSHENGGADELSVAGLSGELADPQPPKTHAASHSDGGTDEVDVTDLAGFPGGTSDFLRADGTFAAPAGGSGTERRILLADGRSTPFDFTDMLQMDDGSDFLWSD